MDMEQAVAERTPVASTGRGANPYVGPKPLQSSDTLYGRTRELHELGDLLLAERIVLLYSPSGAGKTSLINAGLVKRLRDQQGFRVLPPLRVNLCGSERSQDFSNRYMRSVVECLVAELTQEQCAALTETAMPCLSDYLRQRPPLVEDGPVDSPFELLIFDQFEEICTLDPTDVGAKEAFFEELGDALRDRHRWALFVIREDHLAEIDAFSHLLPTALATRYRLNLLTIEQARQAIEGPAKAAGRPFSREQVERLADDLATVTMLGPAGLAEATGVSVEPVQLQVVCRRVWQNGVGGGGPATSQDIRTGAVDEALADFYDTALAKVAREQSKESPKDRERRMRNWIERHLIIKPGIRNQILRGHQHTEELPDDCIGALVSEHLLRVDRRGGRDWIEITHDRMIAPIVNSNERWRKEHLPLYQQRAVLWDRSERKHDMLLPQADYDEALRWQKAHPGRSEGVEKAFLEASRDALARQAALEESRRRSRIWRRTWIGLLAFVALSLLIGTAFLARQEQRTMIEKLNGEALALPQGQYKVTLKNAVEAYGEWQRMHRWDQLARKLLFLPAVQPGTDPLLRDIHSAMLAGLVSVPPAQVYAGSSNEQAVLDAGNKTPQCSVSGPAAVRQIAFSPAPNRKLLAAACADGTVALWNLERPERPLQRMEAGAQAWSVAFNADGTLLAAGSNDGVRLWRIGPDGKPAGPPVTVPSALRAMGVAFDADERLAIALHNGDVSVRDVNKLEPPMASFSHGGRGGVLSSITFMSKGKLAFADWHGNIWVWPWNVPGADVVAPGKSALLNFFEDGPVYEARTENAGIAELVYDKDTDQLAAAGWIKKKVDGGKEEGRAYIASWSGASGTPSLAGGTVRLGREKVAHALAFSPDGSALAFSGGENRTLGFMASGADLPPAAAAAAASVRFQERLFSVAFSPYPSDGGHWVAVGDGEKISMLDLRRAGPVAARSLPLTESFDAEAGQYQAAMSDDGSVVAVGAGTKLAISRQGREVGDYLAVRPVPTGMGAVRSLAIAPQGALVAAGGAGDDPVMLFDRNGQGIGPVPPDLCREAGTVPGDALLAFQPRQGARRLAIASGSSLCVVDVGDPRAPRRVASFASPDRAGIRALAYSSDGSRLAALEGGNMIRVYGDNGVRMEFPAPVTEVTTLAFTPDRRYLAFGTSDADIWILDLDKRAWKRLDQLHDTEIRSLQFAGEKGGEVLVSTDSEGRVMMWTRARTPAGGIGYNRLGRPVSARGSATALSGSGELLLVGSATPRVFDLRMENLLALACRNVGEALEPCRKTP